MKSRITVEVDFDNGNLPIIQILSRDSDDVRDNLIKRFLQSFQHTSRWVRIEYVDSRPSKEDGNDAYRWFLKPITPPELSQEIRLMAGVIDSKFEPSNSEELLKALEGIHNQLGTVNFSSHNQMKESIQESLLIAADAISKHLSQDRLSSENDLSEIDRLKKLIKKSWERSYSLAYEAGSVGESTYVSQTWETFKIENNL